MFRGEPRTTYYDTRLQSIDEKICALIRERKTIAGDNPGLPSEEIFQSWGKTYGHYPDMLRDIFAAMRNEELFKPRVEPKKFHGFVTVMSGKNFGDQFFCVTHLRQYENTSVLSLSISSPVDYKERYADHDERREVDYELEIPNSNYDCRSDNGSGSDGLWVRNYIIAPAIPDELPDLKLIFREQEMFPEQKQTGKLFELSLRGRGMG